MISPLSIESRQLELFIDAVKDYAIYLLTPEGRVASWNSGAERIKGYGADEIIGSHFSRFYTPEDVAAGIPHKALQQAEREGRFDGEGWRVRKDGRRFWAHVTITAFRKDGKLVGFGKVTRDATEQRRMRAQLEDAERLAHLGSWEWDVRSNTIHWSPELYRIYGRTPDTFPATYEAFLSYVHPEDRARLDQTIQDAMATAQPFTFDHRIVRPDGTVRVLHGRGAAERSGGAVVRMIGTGQDVTELRRAEEALRQAHDHLETRVRERTAELELEAERRRRAEEWLETTLHSIRDAVIATDGAGRIVLMNATAAALTGCPRREALGRPLDEIFRIRSEASGRVVEIPIARIAREGALVDLASRPVLLANGGAPVPIDVSASPIRDAEGTTTGIVLVFRDVTERKRSESALRESEARFRIMADSVPVLIWMAGPDTLCTFFNRAWLEFRGRTLQEEAGIGWAQGVHPDDRQRCLETYLAAFHARREFKMEYRLRRHDGAYRWIWDHGIPLLSTDGGFSGYIGSCVDVTERKRKEEQLLFLAELTATLLSRLDYPWRIEKVAEMLVPRFAEWCVIETLGETGAVDMRHVRHVDAAKAEILRTLRQRRRPDPTRLDMARVIRTGESIFLPEVTDAHIHAHVQDAEDAELVARLGVRTALSVPLTVRGLRFGALAIGRGAGESYTSDDLLFFEQAAQIAAVLIENARLYAETKRALDARGEFLTIASHELKTPLTSLQLNLQTALRAAARGHAPAADELLATIQAAHRQGLRLVRLINDLLDITRIASGQLKLTVEDADLTAIARDAFEQLKPEFSDRRCRVDFDLQGPARGRWDRLRLEQVVINLLQNAIRYGEGRPIRVAVQPGASRHRLVVADQGMGMPPEFLARLFQPFQRAVPKDYGGLGMGLYIVRQIVEAHGGHVDVESAVGKGSIFTIDLPLAAPEAAP